MKEYDYTAPNETILYSLNALFPRENIEHKYNGNSQQSTLFQKLCIYTTRQLLGLGNDIDDDKECIDLDTSITLSSETISTDILLDSSVSEELFKELFNIVSTPMYQEKIQALTKHSLPQHTGELIKKMQLSLECVFDEIIVALDQERSK